MNLVPDSQTASRDIQDYEATKAVIAINFIKAQGHQGNKSQKEPILSK